MKTTIPAPFETATSTPACPYERVRLGLGLRVRDVARLTFLVVATALLAIACGGAVDPTEPTQTDAGPTAKDSPRQVCTGAGSDDCPDGSAPILYTCKDGLPPDAFVAQATPDRYQPGSYCAPCSAGVDGCTNITEPRFVTPVGGE